MATTQTIQSPVRAASLMLAGKSAANSECPGYDFGHAMTEAEELVRIGQDFHDFFALQARRIAAMDYSRANCRLAIEIEDAALTAVDALDPYLTGEALEVIYAAVRGAAKQESATILAEVA